MSQTKRQCSDVEFSDIEKKKCQKLRVSFTHFEDISNELIYEIFGFLDGYDLYEAFSNLNSRFTNLLTYSILPIKINLSFMSKSTFQRCYNQIIMSNKHRIESLHLSNPFIVDLIFTPPHIILKFHRLETLILNNIKSKYLGNIFKNLALLPRLFSLTIALADYMPNEIIIYRLIFSLPLLKYCQLSYEKRIESESLLPAVNECSTIEHLVINNPVGIEELDVLLTYIPQLRRLSCYSLYGFNGRKKEMLIVSNNLTHVSLDLKNMEFDEFETLIRYHFNQLRLLRISTGLDDLWLYNRAYLDAKRWQKLILTFMSFLRIFDFQHRTCVNEFPGCEVEYHILIDQFNSSFWSERRWFFAHQHDLQRGVGLATFYSTQPYRRKHYTLYRLSDTATCSRDQKIIFDLVHHVHIKKNHPSDTCLLQFPHVTELTIWHKSNYLITVTLNRFIILTKLTKLNINWDDFYTNKLVELLGFTPNVQTLKLFSITLYTTQIQN